MASVLGNSSRASGAQSGQVKCKLKRRRRRRSKRKGTTLQHFFFSPPFLRVSLFAARAEVVRTLAGASERAAAPPVRPPRAAFTSFVLSTRRGRFTSFFFFFNVPTVENKQNLEERFLFGGAVGSK